MLILTRLNVSNVSNVSRKTGVFSAVWLVLGVMILGSTIDLQSAAADCHRLAEIHRELGFGDVGYPKTSRATIKEPFLGPQEEFERTVITHVSRLGEDVCIGKQLEYVIPAKLGLHRPSSHVFFPNAHIDTVVRAVTEADLVSLWRKNHFRNGDPSVEGAPSFGLGYSRTTDVNHRHWLTPLVEEKQIVFYRGDVPGLGEIVYIMYRVPTEKEKDFDHYDHVGEIIIYYGFEEQEDSSVPGVHVHLNRRFNVKGVLETVANSSLFGPTQTEPMLKDRLRELVANGLQKKHKSSQRSPRSSSPRSPNPLTVPLLGGGDSEEIELQGLK